MRHNRYNAKALVNKGNCMFVRGDLEHARQMYQDLMGYDRAIMETIYGAGPGLAAYAAEFRQPPRPTPWYLRQ